MYPNKAFERDGVDPIFFAYELGLSCFNWHIFKVNLTLCCRWSKIIWKCIFASLGFFFYIIYSDFSLYSFVDKSYRHAQCLIFSCFEWVLIHQLVIYYSLIESAAIVSIFLATIESYAVIIIMKLGIPLWQHIKM